MFQQIHRVKRKKNWKDQIKIHVSPLQNISSFICKEQILVTFASFHIVIFYFIFYKYGSKFLNTFKNVKINFI